MSRKTLRHIIANLQAFQIRPDETGAIAMRLRNLRATALELAREVERLKDRVKELRGEK
jgi:hypothetical protein